MKRHLHDKAVKLVDRWVLVHCAPDRIVLTQGAMMNLANMISNALHESATGRGVRRRDFVDLYGHVCSIQESNIDPPGSTLWLDVDPARMHLSREMAADLIVLLQTFVDTGELPDSMNQPAKPTWIDLSTVGSSYNEERDAFSENWRHRPWNEETWRPGRAPKKPEDDG